MKTAPITQDKFVELVGDLSVQPLGRHSNGSSWLLPCGRIASEMWDGKRWQYKLTEVN